MEQEPLFPSTDVVRRDGTVTPFNAGDAVAAVMDLCRLDDIRVPPRLRARLGRTAKECLEDGYKPEEVVTAMVQALRRGRVDLTEQMLLERDLHEKRGGVEGRSLTPREILEAGARGDFDNPFPWL